MSGKAIQQSSVDKVAIIEKFLRNSSLAKMDDFMFSLDFDLFGAANDPKFFAGTTSDAEEDSLLDCIAEVCVRRIQDAGKEDRAYQSVLFVNAVEGWTIPQLIEFSQKVGNGIRRKDGSDIGEKDRVRVVYTLSRYLGRGGNWSKVQPWYSGNANSNSKSIE